MWYLIIIAGGIFAEVLVLERLMVSGDPAATVANILTHERLYHVGLTAHVIVLLSALALLFVLFRLLKHVTESLAQLMVFSTSCRLPSKARACSISSSLWFC